MGPATAHDTNGAAGGPVGEAEALRSVMNRQVIEARARDKRRQQRI